MVGYVQMEANLQEQLDLAILTFKMYVKVTDDDFRNGSIE